MAKQRATPTYPPECRERGVRTLDVERPDTGLDGPLWPVPFAIGLSRMATRSLTAQRVASHPAGPLWHAAQQRLQHWP